MYIYCVKKWMFIAVMLYLFNLAGILEYFPLEPREIWSDGNSFGGDVVLNTFYMHGIHYTVMKTAVKTKNMKRDLLVWPDRVKPVDVSRDVAKRSQYFCDYHEQFVWKFQFYQNLSIFTKFSFTSLLYNGSSRIHAMP